jgi:hypothetical protein
MRKLTLALALLMCLATAAHATTVVVPDPSPLAYIFYGNGDASVTYDGVLFTQQLVLGNGALYDVGPLFSGDPAVLSSQQASVGVENILVTLPGSATLFSVDYGTFNGSTVTFDFSNGLTFTAGSTGSGYLTPDFFSYSGAAYNSVEITSSDFVLNINNITENSAASPEPGSLLLFGTGLMGLVRVLRRRVAV